ADAHGGQREAAGVQRGERDLEALALAADDVIGGYEHVVESGEAVLQPAQAQETIALLDGDAGRVALDDERGDPAAVAPGLRYLRHDDEQRGERAVGGPQLDAVEPVPALDRYRRRGQPGRVGADVGLGEQEGGYLTAGQPGQVLLLLLLGAEHLERLR